MISVVVPVYNVEKYITKCLESIVNQSYKDFELILVNDGSTDNSVSVINDCLTGKKINWKLINKENGGQSSSKNVGFDNSLGDYIVFLDSDDVVSSDFLYELHKCLIESDADFSFCNFRYVKEQIAPNDKNDKEIIFSKEQLIEKFLKRTIDFVAPSMMYKKDFLIDNNIRFNESIRFSEDQMYIWDTILHSKKSVYLYKTMYGYYLREKSIMTASPFDRISDAYDIYSNYCEKILTNNNDYIKYIKFILPRWVLGTLYSSSSLVNYEEFKILCNKMNSKKLVFSLFFMKEIKAIMLATVFFISTKIAYIFCRKIQK